MKIRSLFWVFVLFIAAAPLTSGEKVTVAVMDFDAKNSSQENAEAVTDLLRTELFNTGHFIVIERERIKKIIEEQKFQSSGLTDADQAAEIGRLLNVKKIMMGTVTVMGGSYIINTRIVDVQSGQVILAEAVECRDGEDMLPSSIAELALKIAYKVGLEGKIIRITADGLFVDLGSADGLKIGDMLDVFRLGETITDLEGHVIGTSDEFIGNIVIVKVQERFSVSTSELSVELFKKGDKVKPHMEGNETAIPEPKQPEKTPPPKEKKKGGDSTPDMPAVF